MSVITGRAFIDALLSSGVITPEQNVRRVVIDVSVDAVIVMHLERYGDKRLFEVVPALTGVEIHRDPVADEQDPVTLRLLYGMWRNLPRDARDTAEWVMDQETLDRVNALCVGGDLPVREGVTYLFDRPVRIDPTLRGIRLNERAEAGA